MRQTFCPGDLQQFANRRWPINPVWSSLEKAGSIPLLSKLRVPYPALRCHHHPFLSQAVLPISRVVMQRCPSALCRHSPGRTQNSVCNLQCATVPVSPQWRQPSWHRSARSNDCRCLFSFPFQLVRDPWACPCPVPISPYTSAPHLHLLISVSSHQLLLSVPASPFISSLLSQPLPTMLPLSLYLLLHLSSHHCWP